MEEMNLCYIQSGTLVSRMMRHAKEPVQIARLCNKYISHVCAVDGELSGVFIRIYLYKRGLCFHLCKWFYGS